LIDRGAVFGRTRVASLVLVGVFAFAREAQATCRSSTGCPDARGNLLTDAIGDTCYEPVDACASQPLAWETPCVGFSVDALGSALRGISAEETQAVAQAAFDQWLGPVCDGESPSLSVQFLATSDCATFEYNPAGSSYGNSNTIFFVDGPTLPKCGAGAGTGDTIGDTCTSFEPTGEIVDADIALDSHTFSLAPPDSDLRSVLLHEVGHFLGMAHVTDPNDVMYPRYTGALTLSVDNIRSICAAYPPGRHASGACTYLPRHGFSAECAADQQRLTCGAAGRPGAAGSWVGVLAALLGAVTLGCRKR
jgi:hypothetical protein